MSVSSPEVLISLGPELVPNYAEAVNAFGGHATAAWLPEADPAGYDMLVLSGGGDVDPARYGEANEQCFGIDDARDEAELRLVEAFIRAGKPILGICRGHQLLNVYFGGKLIRHLPTADTHMPTRSGDRVHETEAMAGSFVEQLYGNRFPTNSAHHQGFSEPAPGLIPVQRTADGVVEACRHQSLPIWSVQWHPERMCLTRQRPDAVDGAALFRAFLNRTLR